LRDKKALIIKFGQIGDVIMAIPAVRALYEQGFEIDWVCGKAVEPLLACYSWMHVIRIDDKAIFFGRTMQRVGATAKLWRKLALKKYDLCATLYYDKRYRLLILPVRSRRTVMLNHLSRATTLIPSRHPTDEFMRVLLEVEDGCRGQSTAPARPDRLPPPPSRSKGDARRIAIFAGGVQHLVREQATQRLPEQALRRWPVENFVTVAEELCRREWEVVLMGAPDDAWVRSHFEHLTVTDCVGKLSLPEVVSTCDSCDAVITHDTGPLHLAGLSEACLVGIFGPTDPSTRVPRRPGAVGIWGGQGFACRPCYDGRNFAPCRLNGCMHQVTPELVMRELDRLLDARSLGLAIPWHVVCPGDP
jgi:heptosyltransferase-2